MKFPLSLLAFTLLTPVARGEEVRCHRFDLPALSGEGHLAVTRAETWCYATLGANEGTFLYNADDGHLRPELALLVGADGLITQGTLVGGKVEVRSGHLPGYQPFPVPLAEPTGPVASFAGARALDPTAQSWLTRFRAARRAGAALQGVDSLNVPMRAAARVEPWRGYWWPFRGAPIAGALEKFDRFVAARAGYDPLSARWERDHHRASSLITWWEGHCNGWAAAAILRAEPREPLVDPLSGQNFSVSEQKAVLTEADFCAKVAFFGKRYNGRRDDPYDVHPAVFHQTLAYWIGQMGKPVAMDYHANAKVDTHVISGYAYDMRPLGNHTYEVTATLNVHQYDREPTEVPGPAPAYTKVYRYRLTLNERNEPVLGQWLTENPDFLWVPLGPGRCQGSNPQLPFDYVEQLSRAR